MRKPKTAPPATTFESDSHYQVELSRTVRCGRTMLRPGADITLKGRVINGDDKIREALVDARPVAG
jgi:hypothetical protein